MMRSAQPGPRRRTGASYTYTGSPFVVRKFRRADSRYFTKNHCIAGFFAIKSLDQRCCDTRAPPGSLINHARLREPQTAPGCLDFPNFLAEVYASALLARLGMQYLDEMILLDRSARTLEALSKEDERRRKRHTKIVAHLGKFKMNQSHTNEPPLLPKQVRNRDQIERLQSAHYWGFSNCMTGFALSGCEFRFPMFHNRGIGEVPMVCAGMADVPPLPVSGASTSAIIKSSSKTSSTEFVEGICVTKTVTQVISQTHLPSNTERLPWDDYIPRNDPKDLTFLFSRTPPESHVLMKKASPALRHACHIFYSSLTIPLKRRVIAIVEGCMRNIRTKPTAESDMLNIARNYVDGDDTGSICAHLKTWDKCPSALINPASCNLKALFGEHAKTFWTRVGEIAESKLHALVDMVNDQIAVDASRIYKGIKRFNPDFDLARAERLASEAAANVANKCYSQSATGQSTIYPCTCVECSSLSALIMGAKPTIITMQMICRANKLPPDLQKEADLVLEAAKRLVERLRIKIAQMYNLTHFSSRLVHCNVMGCSSVSFSAEQWITDMQTALDTVSKKLKLPDHVSTILGTTPAGDEFKPCTHPLVYARYAYDFRRKIVDDDGRVYRFTEHEPQWMWIPATAIQQFLTFASV